jgi:uncharacterized protein (TIGR00369 family)
MSAREREPGLDAAHGLPTSGPDRHVPFLALLGAQRERAADGEAVVGVALTPPLLNNHGGGHGGVVMTVLDNAMANAALSRVAFAQEVVTVDIHVAFMRPAAGRLTATARVCGGGKSVCFCEAEAADETGRIVAKAMGTFRYRRPAPGRGEG